MNVGAKSNKYISFNSFHVFKYFTYIKNNVKMFDTVKIQ